MKCAVSTGEPVLQAGTINQSLAARVKDSQTVFDLSQHEFASRTTLTSFVAGGLTFLAVSAAVLPAKAGSVILEWENRPQSWGEFGYTNGPSGWTNVQLRLWAGSTSNHFDRYLVIPSSAMTNAQILGIQSGSRTYFTMTAFMRQISAQSGQSNVAIYDSPASGPPTPIRRDSSTPTINFDQMSPGSLTIPDPNQPPTNSVPNLPTTISMVFADSGQPELTVLGSSGKTFVIQRSPDLSAWYSVGSATIPTATNVPQGFLQVVTFTDEDPAANRTNAASMYYRTLSDR